MTFIDTNRDHAFTYITLNVLCKEKKQTDKQRNKGTW